MDDSGQPEPSETRPPPVSIEAVRQLYRKRGRLASPLTRRILAVNMMAPIILVAGLFYLDRYKNELIAAELESLRIRSEMEAAALSEGAVIDNGAALPELSPVLASHMLSRLSPPARVRTRLFDADGDQFADSKQLVTNSPSVQIENLVPPERGWFTDKFRLLYDYVMSTRLGSENLPRYFERKHPRAIDFPEVIRALSGDVGFQLRNSADRRLLMFAAVPIQRYKRVLGVVLVSSSGDEITQSLFQVRLTIFETFAFALGITGALSLYLAGTIARPIRRLAVAAERVRLGRGRSHFIPELVHRKDEIGELAEALHEMTEALWRRMDAIEAFAADVAHEIKNPLTSLRSAVETVGRVQNDEQRARLMAVIQEDVTRLDRLISDISDASRVDAEMSRAETAPVSFTDMLVTMASIYHDSGVAENVTLSLDLPPSDALAVIGIEGRLGQVLRNLLANALSFSPPGAAITLRGRRHGANIIIEIEDCGPGIPENKLEAIFDRFYSERPSAEKFGTHSGLGLSISKQIIEAHDGTIRATNRLDATGKVMGAVFTLRLPAAVMP